MHSMEITGKTVYFKNIRFGDLPHILEWYNRVEDFQYATGTDTPMTFDMLAQRYARIAASNNDFFVGVYNREDKMVGIVKGRFQIKNRAAVWISSIVIDSPYQNKGYGSTAVDMVLDYMKTHNRIQAAYLSVVEDNFQGRSFWDKREFKVLKVIENHVRLKGRKHNIIIMYKIL